MQLRCSTQLREAESESEGADSAEVVGGMPFLDKIGVDRESRSNEPVMESAAKWSIGCGSGWRRPS